MSFSLLDPEFTIDRWSGALGHSNIRRDIDGEQERQGGCRGYGSSVYFPEGISSAGQSEYIVLRN